MRSVIGLSRYVQRGLPKTVSCETRVSRVAMFRHTTTHLPIGLGIGRSTLGTLELGAAVSDCCSGSSDDAGPSTICAIAKLDCGTLCLFDIADLPTSLKRRAAGHAGADLFCLTIPLILPLKFDIAVLFLGGGVPIKLMALLHFNS